MIQLINIINHSTIKIKPVDVKSNTYIDSSEEINKVSKFEIGDIVRIPKYKNIYKKLYVPNCCEEFFVIKKVKNTLPGYNNPFNSWIDKKRHSINE